MSYKDSREFHKDFGDGGRKARASIEQIQERKSNKHRNILTDQAAATASTTDTTDFECNSCGYIGDQNEDFTKTAISENGDFAYECPVCSSIDSQPYIEESF